MGEIEVDLLKVGYQLTDVTDDGPCCGDDQGSEGYRCSWKIERVTLPSCRSAARTRVAAPAGDAGLDLGPISLLAGLNHPEVNHWPTNLAPRIWPRRWATRRARWGSRR